MRYEVTNIKALKEWLDGFLASLKDWKPDAALHVRAEWVNGKIVYYIKVEE